MQPTEFIIEETDEIIVSQSGLALAGTLLGSTGIAKRADELKVPQKPQPLTRHSDVLISLIGLLCLGKSDFTDIETFRDDEFFRRSLGLEKVPTEPTLRQRLGEFGNLPQKLLREESAEMVRRHAPEITCCFQDWVALDVDVSPFDNSDTKKEGVGWTYKQVDGFAPIFAYLGAEGYLVDEEFREGTQHSQKGTPEFLSQAIGYARKVTGKKLLVRLDSGNDAESTLETCRKAKADFIVKRNLRKESPEDWLVEAQCFGKYREPRAGKRVYVGETAKECGERWWRVVFEVTERTITAEGQRLLLPTIEVATYWTSLKKMQATPDEVIRLYRDHATSEQFHSELKTDLDLERLPSGHFAVNALVLTCGLVAYNVLRLIGQRSLRENERLSPGQRAPQRKAVKRRRLRSVIQDLMYLASRLVNHARRWALSLPRCNPWRGVWREVYVKLRGGMACRA